MSNDNSNVGSSIFDPKEVLEEIMDPCVQKNEYGWVAKREIDSLRDDVKALGILVAIKDRHIERLERLKTGGITNSQIDKMWRELNRDVAWSKAEAEQHDEQRRVVKSFLAMIGIVECPECGGSGRYESSWEEKRDRVLCHRCQGHGWIREES